MADDLKGQLDELVRQANNTAPTTMEDLWQPIETAPRNDDVLVWVPCGKWQTGGYVTVGVFDCDCWSDRLNEEEPIFPTHWMLFPKAPASVDIHAKRQDPAEGLGPKDG